MKKEKSLLSFSIKEGNHILIPNNEVSRKSQEFAFRKIEDLQFELIKHYNVFSDSMKIKLSNEICCFFIRTLLNGDGAPFRLLVGYEHKGLMTNEELKNIFRDYEIAKKKIENNDFKTFLLLDLCTYSNRRADAIIITNDYKIELFDFSEGKVVEKIKYEDETNLSESELVQKKRKEKQQKRIDSFKNKIKADCTPIRKVIVDNKETNITFIELKTTFYSFNDSYKYFLDHNREKCYIPNSICFLYNEITNKNLFISFPLKYNIDSPFFITEKKPIIDSKIIEDIYMNNTYIGISIPYALMFINEFTFFKIHATKRQDKNLGKNQMSLLFNGKRKYIYFEDTRTNKWIAISWGFVHKHVYMNIDLKSMMIYIDSICNPECEKEFINNVIKYNELKNSEYNFFIVE